MIVPQRGYNLHVSINDNEDANICADSNLVIISGNIAGRTMSDSGYFTKCICESFGKNVERILKADFHSIYVEIGNNLEEKTNHAELCNINGTLRFNPVRFEKDKNEKNEDVKDEDKKEKKMDNEFNVTRYQSYHYQDSSRDLNQRLLNECDYYQL